MHMHAHMHTYTPTHTHPHTHTPHIIFSLCCSPPPPFPFCASLSQFPCLSVSVSLFCPFYSVCSSVFDPLCPFLSSPFLPLSGQLCWHIYRFFVSCIFVTGLPQAQTSWLEQGLYSLSCRLVVFSLIVPPRGMILLQCCRAAGIMQAEDDSL